MATLTADRHYVQRSLLDPHEEERDQRIVPPPQVAPPCSPQRAEPTPTFDDLVSRTWDELIASHSATCFVCGGDVAPRWSAGPRPVGGRCTRCGSELS